MMERFLRWICKWFGCRFKRFTTADRAYCDRCFRIWPDDYDMRKSS